MLPTNALAYYAKEWSVMNVPILFQALKIFLSGETNCSISGATTFSIMTLSILTLYVEHRFVRITRRKLIIISESAVCKKFLGKNLVLRSQSIDF